MFYTSEMHYVWISVWMMNAFLAQLLWPSAQFVCGICYNINMFNSFSRIIKKVTYQLKTAISWL